MGAVDPWSRTGTQSLRLGGEHLQRFHGDPSTHLQSYTCFHGDEQPRTGKSLTRSAFPKGAAMQLGPSPYATSKAAGTITSLRGAGRGASATMHNSKGYDLSGATLVRPGAGIPTGTVTLNGRMFTSTSTPYDSGVTYMYQTGAYTSKTGLPPLAYKPLTTEYLDEYREPEAMREALREMTARYGTSTALQTGRYQLNGYPPSKTMLESSLTRRLQTAPNYETRVVAY